MKTDIAKLLCRALEGDRGASGHLTDIVLASTGDAWASIVEAVVISTLEAQELARGDLLACSESLGLFAIVMLVLANPPAKMQARISRQCHALIFPQAQKHDANTVS
nr:hypothetical protein [uncultured Enterobacter sp.]